MIENDISQKDLLTALCLSRSELFRLERSCPDLFAPVRRHGRRKVYSAMQARIMRQVLNGNISTADGAELLSRCNHGEIDTIYGAAGDCMRLTG